MLNELFKLVTAESGEQIINNPQIPNDKNETAVKTTTDSILDSLKGEISSGNGAGVLNLLGGKSEVQGNPLIGNLTNNVTGSLMDKLGIYSPVAKQIAGALVPVILGKLVNKTNDPGDNDFNLNSIFGSLTGGKTDGFDLGSLLGGGSPIGGSPIGGSPIGGSPEGGLETGEQNTGIESIFNMLKDK